MRKSTGTRATSLRRCRWLRASRSWRGSSTRRSRAPRARSTPTTPGKSPRRCAPWRRTTFAALHVEAPTSAATRATRRRRWRAIELLDSEVFVPLCKGLAALGDYRLLFLSDHYTPISTRTHDGTAVPYLLYDSRDGHGNGQPYSEAGAAASGARMEEGTDLMPLLFAR